MNSVNFGLSTAAFSFILLMLLALPLLQAPAGFALADYETSRPGTVTIYLDSVSRNTGTDCLEEEGPSLITNDSLLVKVQQNLNTNKQFDLSWFQLCSATSYELQISPDPEFKRVITVAADGNSMELSNSGAIRVDFDYSKTASPTAHIAEGMMPESGAGYSWRVRAYKTENGRIIRSPWSEVRHFVVLADVYWAKRSYDVVPLQPYGPGFYADNITFSWSPWYSASKYQIELANDRFFRKIVFTGTSPTTSYMYNGSLEAHALYYWHVRALEVNRRSMPSDWSSSAHFTTGPTSPPESAPTPPLSAILTGIGADTTISVAVGIAVGLVIVGLVWLISRKTMHRHTSSSKRQRGPA